MQYNSHATGQDCISEIDRICGSNSTTYPTNDKTRRFNFALDRYLHLATIAGKQWPFDDSGQASPPLLTQTLTSGTNTYKLSGFSGTFLSLQKLEVLDGSSNPSELTFEEFHNIEADFGDKYSTTSTGTPTHYTLFGEFIYLRPTPSYTLASALRAFATRQLLYMAATDTTREPGIPRIHHLYLCRYAALPYLIEKRLPNKNDIAAQIQQDEKEILEYFGYRNSDVPRRIVPMRQNNK